MSRAAALAPFAWKPIVDFTKDAPGIIETGGLVSATGPYWQKTNEGLKIGFSSALGTGTQGASARWFPSADLDLSDYDIIYVELGNPVESFTPYMQLFIGADAANVFTNYLTSTALAGGATKSHFNGVHAQRFVDFGRFGTGVASEKNITRAIKKIEFRFRTSVDVPEPQYVVVKRLWTIKPTALFTVSYDNIYDSIYTTAFAAWASLGVQGTLFMSGTDIGSPSTMTPAQIDEMYAAGWDIGLQNYDDTLSVYVNTASSLTQLGGVATWTNSPGIPHLLSPGDLVSISGAVQQGYNGVKTVLTTPTSTQFTFAVDSSTVSPATGALITAQRPGYTTPAEVAEDVFKSRAVAEQYGWTRGNDIFAYSTGAFDAITIKGMDLAGCKFARSANVGVTTNRRGYYPAANTLEARMTLPIISMDNQTATTVLAAIDNAIAYGLTANLSGHGVKTTADSLHMATAEFTLLLAGLKKRIDAGLIAPIRFSDMWKRFHQGRLIA